MYTLYQYIYYTYTNTKPQDKTQDNQKWNTFLEMYIKMGNFPMTF